MQFVHARTKVHNRGVPPQAFLDELVAWAKTAPDEIFEVNDKIDIYSFVKPELGPWRGLAHRKAAMLEVLRVLGGFESSWNWKEGVDKANPTSNTPCTEEAGLFQCSGNSITTLDLKVLFAKHAGVAWAPGSKTCDTFRALTKTDHAYCIEHTARLLRVTTGHHGPVKRKEINKWLSQKAVAEFEAALSGL